VPAILRQALVDSRNSACSTGPTPMTSSPVMMVEPSSGPEGVRNRQAERRKTGCAYSLFYRPPWAARKPSRQRFAVSSSE